jgi:predicted XRE-type DNA-binding protein
MRADKRRKLERAGWAVGDADDFLQLSDEEHRLVETKLALAAGLRRWREHLGLTQTQVAARFGSSQSRVVDVACLAECLETPAGKPLPGCGASYGLRMKPLVSLRVT